MPQPMPRSRRLLYALGSTGFNITDGIVVGIAIYFYLPPEGRGLAIQVPKTVFLGVLTAFGVANLVGRVFDMVSDPLVGYASDRSRSRLGRRRVFLLWGLLPMVGFPVLLFWPPGAPGSLVNAAWVAGILSLYFIFFTVYVAPYLALLPEIAWQTPDRVNLSTLLALVQIPALVFGAGWGVGRDWAVAAGLDPTTAVRAVVVVASVLAALLCALPILAVDERRFCTSNRSELPIRQAVARTLGNRPFRRYLVAQIPFIIGINMIRPIGTYYATVVLGRSEGFMVILAGVLFVVMLVAFAPVNRYARRAGPKRTIIGCVSVLCLSVAILGLLHPDVPGGPHDATNLALVCLGMAGAGVAVAGFTTMPNVLIAQVVDYDTAHTGANRAAMYFGVQGFATKLLYGVSTAILAFLFSRFGNSAHHALGVLLVGPVAAGFCLLSALLFLRYPEHEVLAASLSEQIGRGADEAA